MLFVCWLLFGTVKNKNGFCLLRPRHDRYIAEFRPAQPLIVVVVIVIVVIVVVIGIVIAVIVIVVIDCSCRNSSLLACSFSNCVLTSSAVCFVSMSRCFVRDGSGSESTASCRFRELFGRRAAESVPDSLSRSDVGDVPRSSPSSSRASLAFFVDRGRFALPEPLFPDLPTA